jgi:hypothetical protein
VREVFRCRGRDAREEMSAGGSVVAELRELDELGRSGVARGEGTFLLGICSRGYQSEDCE